MSPKKMVTRRLLTCSRFAILAIRRDAWSQRQRRRVLVKEVQFGMSNWECSVATPTTSLAKLS